jgi:beta-glucanase (GH16 family)
MHRAPMKPGGWLVVAAVGLAGIGVAAAQTGRTDGGRSVLRAPKPIFRDEFNGDRLNQRIWTPCHWWAKRGCTIAGNHELEWYLPGQVSVRGGALRLTADRRAVRASDGQTHPFTSGMISSGPPSETGRPGFAFRYGRAEIRARIPAGRGLWSAFWLLPANRNALPEIDVMEIVEQPPRTVEMHLHYAGRDGTDHDQGGRWTTRSLATGWHRFAIDWRPRALTWLVDGVRRFRVTGNAVPSQPMYLVANLAVGGDWPGAPDASTPFPSALQIDYVRVWR